jgi:hypothetical protein
MEAKRKSMHGAQRPTWRKGEKRETIASRDINVKYQAA